jgi:hypothetical protein
MKTLRHRRRLGIFGIGLTLASLTGCQTWTYQSGMTLPSPHYLDGHRPQYIPPSPEFPLERELAQMQQAQPGGIGAAPGVPGPAILPPP